MPPDNPSPRKKNRPFPEAAFHFSRLIFLDHPDFPDHFLDCDRFKPVEVSSGVRNSVPGSEQRPEIRAGIAMNKTVVQLHSECLQRETGCDIILSGPASL